MSTSAEYQDQDIEILLSLIVPFLQIEIVCIMTSILYGIINDKIVSHICISYFTRGFHRIASNYFPFEWVRNWSRDETSPNKVAVIWGTMATFQLGFALGIPVSLACLIGDNPLYASSLYPLCITTVLGLLVYSILCGIDAYHHPRDDEDDEFDKWVEEGEYIEEIRKRGKLFYTDLMLERHNKKSLSSSLYYVDKSERTKFKIVREINRAGYSGAPIAAIFMCLGILFQRFIV